MLSEKIFLLHILTLYMFIFINEFSLFVCLIKGSIFIHMFDTLCTYQGHTLVSLVTCATPLFPWFDRFGHTSRACQFSPLFIGSWSSGFYFCHQCVWQSGFHIWTVTMKWLGTLQLRRWHISDGDQCFWEAVALHCCESGREWWKWKGMGRSEIYKWGFMLASGSTGTSDYIGRFPWTIISWPTHKFTVTAGFLSTWISNAKKQTNVVEGQWNELITCK